VMNIRNIIRFSAARQITAHGICAFIESPDPLWPQHSAES
jgi:hypothetical protein